MNVIIGQAHFVKTVEDLHEALAGSSPQLRFGIACCVGTSLRSVHPIGPGVASIAGKAGHGDSRSILQLPE